MKSKHFTTALFVCLLFILCFSAESGAGPDDDVREYKLKAAFILNFAKLTTWPEGSFTEPGRSFNFCVAGENPFGSALDGIESKQVGGRNVQLQFIPSVAEAQSCHVVFVSKSVQENIGLLQQVTDGFPVITISDISEFSSSGGIFEFVTKNGKLSFIVNNQQASRNGLQISSSLLNLAAEVR